MQPTKPKQPARTRKNLDGAERLLFAFRAVKPDLHHIQIHVDELDKEAKSIGNGREARPWLSWDELKMP